MITEEEKKKRLVDKEGCKLFKPEEAIDNTVKIHYITSHLCNKKYPVYIIMFLSNEIGSKMRQSARKVKKIVSYAAQAKCVANKIYSSTCLVLQLSNGISVTYSH